MARKNAPKHRASAAADEPEPAEYGEWKAHKVDAAAKERNLARLRRIEGRFAGPQPLRHCAAHAIRWRRKRGGGVDHLVDMMYKHIR